MTTLAATLIAIISLGATALIIEQTIGMVADSIEWIFGRRND